MDLSTAPDQGGAVDGSDGRPDVPPTPGDPGLHNQLEKKKKIMKILIMQLS